MHRYYLSYHHPSGFGATSLERDEPICDWGDVEAIRVDLEQYTGFSNIVILGWQEFDVAPTVAGS